MKHPSPLLLRRLYILAHFRYPPLDNRVAREQALTAIARALHLEADALRLEAAAREIATELKRVPSRAQAQDLEHDLILLHLRLASSIFELDITPDNFWISTGLLLNRIPRRVVLSPEAAPEPSSLDATLAQLISFRPSTLTFPSAEIPDDSQHTSLLFKVLTDQRGLDPSAPRAQLHYDRRYVAVLRARLGLVEAKAEALTLQLRACERGLESALTQSSLEDCYSCARQALQARAQVPQPSPSCLPVAVDTADTHRRLAATLRDLAQELEALPSRLERSALVPRKAPPSWLSPLLGLCRLAAFDATSLGYLS